jgi:hypothetical protein
VLTNIAIHGDDAGLKGGYFAASQSMAGYTITLHRMHGEWRIVSSVMDMMASIASRDGRRERRATVARG